tara:strand:- start:19462 stop:19920 length:459 start_codon:yes stop_codon:yes gene_type:complete
MNRLWFDGSITENPGGKMGWGFVAEYKEVFDKHQWLVHGDYKYSSHAGVVGYWEYKGPKTNNVAEYFGLIYALDYAHIEGWDEIAVHGDSLLVIQQSNGNWKVKQPHLKALCKDVQDRMDLFEKITLKWIPREENPEADKMAKKAINNGDNE